MAIWLLCTTPFLNNIQNWVLVVDKGILDAVHVLNVGNVLVLHFTQLVIARCIVKGIRPEKAITKLLNLKISFSWQIEIFKNFEKKNKKNFEKKLKILKF